MRLALQPLPHKRVHGTQAVQHGRVVLLVERQRRQPHLQQRAHLVRVAPLAVVFLARLQKARVVDAAVALQLVGFLCDLVQLAFDVLERLLARLIIATAAATAAWFLLLLLRLLHHLAIFLDAHAQWLQHLLALGCLVLQALHRLGLEGIHLLQLHVDQLFDKARLVILSPLNVVLLCGANGRRARPGRVFLEQLLELVVVDVLVLPWRVGCAFQRLAVAHCSL